LAFQFTQKIMFHIDLVQLNRWQENTKHTVSWNDTAMLRQPTDTGIDVSVGFNNVLLERYFTIWSIC
jgi:hypothetical protein